MKRYLLLTVFVIYFQSAFPQAQCINIGSERGYYPYFENYKEFSSKNHPGICQREELVWHSNDNIYLYSINIYANDYFWFYSKNKNQWSCLNKIPKDPIYGPIGVFTDSTSPGLRKYSATFTDVQGNLFILGGVNEYGQKYNDLWKFDISIEQWAWIGGYSEPGTNLNGISGPTGVESSDYFPSFRTLAMAVQDSDGFIYIYGGHGPDNNEHENRYDLWRFNTNNNSWTLLYNPSESTQNIEQLGVESTNNRPGPLMCFSSWYYNHYIYIFGGQQEMTTSDEARQNKVWRYNLNSNKWACIKSPATNAAEFGEQLIENSTNTPLSLSYISNAVVLNNDAYLFGGYADYTPNYGEFNIMWKFNMNTNNWVWMKGDTNTYHPGFFGKKNFERTENLPFSRISAIMWLENNQIKLFGGRYNYFYGTNEFWNYNPSTNNFTWIDGINAKNVDHYVQDITKPSVYNILQTSSNKWGENGEKLWFLAAYNYSEYPRGMFEYNISTSTLQLLMSYPNQYNTEGIYGQMGVADSHNIPPGRNYSLLWETNDKLYLMGGYGNYHYYNDFWEFDKTTKMWTWIKGSKNDETPYSHYSEIGVESPDNYPLSRSNAQTWVDISGNLWLYSGSGTGGYLNDLWKYNRANNTWILFGGNQTYCSTNQDYFLETYPPFVRKATCWSHGNDLYFYGGEGIGKYKYFLTIGQLNDIWKYSINSKQWKRISGTRYVDCYADYGIKQHGAFSNHPGSRKDFASWSDSYGNLWMYGGIGRGEDSLINMSLYDLWKFDISLNTWIWMDGIKNPRLYTDSVFLSNDFNFPQRLSSSSVSYKGIGKYYVDTYLERSIWEFDISNYPINYNIIEGYARFNQSGNCDTSDRGVANLKIKLSNLDNNFILTNLDGYYKIYTPSLQNTLQVVGLGNHPEYYKYSPETEIVNFNGYNNSKKIDVCVSPKGVCNDLEIAVIPIGIARPGFDNTYKIICRNNGNSNISGYIEFKYNEFINDYVSASIEPDIQDSGLLVWNFSDFLPFENKVILVKLNLNSSSEDPSVNDGDILTFLTEIQPIDEDKNPFDNKNELCQTVVNSVDPNHKQCLQGEKVSASIVGENVTYKIDFENIGTGTAVNVYIIDTIDVNKFEINSIRIVDASHTYTFEITEKNIVNFHFESIYLKGQSSESRFGYIVFMIKLKSDLLPGDNFSNFANIYFDYNYPLETNTYTTTIQELGIDDSKAKQSLIYYPNPVLDYLNLKGIQINKTEVIDLTGRIILEKEIMDDKVNLSQLLPGFYLIRVYTKNGIQVLKILKQ